MVSCDRLIYVTSRADFDIPHMLYSECASVAYRRDRDKDRLRDPDIQYLSFFELDKYAHLRDSSGYVIVYNESASTTYAGYFTLSATLRSHSSS